jgi:glycosyltransferase involved in cell wall biosynthesis
MNMQIQKPDAWVVVDNSKTPAYDWSVSAKDPRVVYEKIHEPKTIGWLRNRCLEKALELGADYIVFWDDDDYYPPTRISSGVRALEDAPTADISGSSKMFLFLTRENVMLTTGPFGDTHATAATHTIRRRYAETHRFPDKARGEELDFTGGWTARLVQVPSEEMIVVMGHSQNTVNKSDILKRLHVYRATIANSDNGKMFLRARWPVPWGVFQTTFYT